MCASCVLPSVTSLTEQSVVGLWTLNCPEKHFTFWDIDFYGEFCGLQVEKKPSPGNMSKSCPDFELVPLSRDNEGTSVLLPPRTSSFPTYDVKIISRQRIVIFEDRNKDPGQQQHELCIDPCLNEVSFFPWSCFSRVDAKIVKALANWKACNFELFYCAYFFFHIG